jgi:hypothetical protein
VTKLKQYNKLILVIGILLVNVSFLEIFIYNSSGCTFGLIALVIFNIDLKPSIDSKNIYILLNFSIMTYLIIRLTINHRLYYEIIIYLLILLVVMINNLKCIRDKYIFFKHDQQDINKDS